VISGGLKRVEKGKFNPPKTGGARVENGLEPPKGAQPFNPPRLGRSERKPWLGDLLAERFGAAVVWVERRGATVHGARPRWLDWPVVNGADIAREPWKPLRKRKEAS